MAQVFEEALSRLDAPQHRSVVCSHTLTTQKKEKTKH